MISTKNLFKTTIVIWTDYDPGDSQEISLGRLGQEADSGGAYCSHVRTEFVSDPTDDPEWDDSEFLDGEDEEDDAKEEVQ